MKLVQKLLAIAISLFILAPHAFAKDPDDKKKLKIGLVVSLSGDAANNGEAIRKGAQLAADELRAKGWSIDLNLQDDATNPTKSVSSYQYLLSQGYRIFLGPTWSFEVNAIAPILAKAGGVTIVPAGSSDINGGAHEGIFSLCPPRTGELSKITEWLKTKNYKKAFILTPLGDWGVVHREVYLTAAKAAGIEVSGDEQIDYGLDPGALKTIMLRAKAKGADLLLTTAGASDIANMLKIRADLHWESGFLTTEDLWDALDAGIAGDNELILKDVWVIGLPLAKEFAKKFETRFKEQPKMYADRAYDGLMLLAKAVEATDGTPNAVKNYLKGLSSFEGVTGSIRFNDAGDKAAENYQIMRALNNKSRS